jgi:hypothetical protein
VVGSDPSDGGWADRPSVDDERTVELADSLAALGRSEAPGSAAQAITGSPAGLHMTTVPCGATSYLDCCDNTFRSKNWASSELFEPVSQNGRLMGQAQKAMSSQWYRRRFGEGIARLRKIVPHK